MEDDILANLVNFRAVREMALKKKKKNSTDKQRIGKKFSKNKQEKLDKEKSIKNKNKDKILQTQTFKDSKNTEKKEIIVKTKWENENNLTYSQEKNSIYEKESPFSLRKDLLNELNDKTILGKRSLEAIHHGDENFLKFSSKEDQEENLTTKGEELQTIDEAFNTLKKIKKESDGHKNAKEVYLNHKGNFQNIENTIFEENEKQFAPWMTKSTSKIENPTIRFHNEIIDFVEYIGPSQKEDSLRKKSFEKLSETVKEILPQATVKPFGSFVTNLYLPQSDIDVAVIEPTFGAQALLNKLAKAFMKHSDYECVNVIRSAKVPLVKIIERNTGINFDISFNKMDGINQVKEIEKALEFYPEMRYLIILVKCFLKQRDLNETFQGGIGSFLLFCLVLAFLREVRKEYKNNNREEDIDKILLSEFALKFLDFYANFDIVRKQIVLVNGGGIVDKYVRDYALSVISPQDTSHDIGKVVFRVKEVFGIFRNRFHFMMNYSFKKGESLLKYLISGIHL